MGPPLYKHITYVSIPKFHIFDLTVEISFFESDGQSITHSHTLVGVGKGVAIY